MPTQQTTLLQNAFSSPHTKQQGAGVARRLPGVVHGGMTPLAPHRTKFLAAIVMGSRRRPARGYAVRVTLLEIEVFLSRSHGLTDVLTRFAARKTGEAVKKNRTVILEKR